MKIYDEPQFRHAMRNSDAADALRFIRGIHGSDTKAARASMENFVSCWAGKPDNSKVTSKLTLKQRDEKLLVNRVDERSLARAIMHRNQSPQGTTQCLRYQLG